MKDNSKCVPFPGKPEEDLSIDEMDLTQLKAYLGELQEMLAGMDAREPADEESDAYRRWADKHEAIEDTIDDVLDQIDELEA